MASSTAIANLALTKLGEPNPILALTDDTNAGRVMNRLFTLVRDAELRRNRWKFAIKRTSLSALADAPDWGYAYQYPLPADFLAVVQVNDFFVRAVPSQPAMWSMETAADGSRVLLTNLTAPLKFRYVSRVENTGFFDPLFAEAMACKLAYEACEQLTQSTTKKQGLRVDYKEALIEAARCDAIENPPDALPWGSWLDSREGGSSDLSGDSGNTIFPSGFVIS